MDITTILDLVNAQLPSAVLGGISGAFVGFFSAWLKESINKKGHRKRLCTAILAEVGRLSKQIQIIVTDANKGSLGNMELYFPFISSPKEYVPLFRPNSIEVVSGLFGLLSELKRMLNEHERNPNDALRIRIGKLGESIYYLCAIAIHRLVKNENGKVPTVMAFQDKDQLEQISYGTSNIALSVDS